MEKEGKMKSIVAACAALAAFALPAVQVKMYETRSGGTIAAVEREIPNCMEEAWNTPCVDLDEATVSHPYTGLGGSFAEASCRLLMSVPAECRRAILEDFFTKKGLNLSMARLHVGSSDYSSTIYCYDDVPDDFEMKHFSIDHDRKEIIPVVKEALAVNPDIYLFSSPWSPPGWMKTNGGPFGGWMLSKYLEAFCDYYVAYLKAYLAEGIRIRALTIQNEPECGRPGSATCQWHPEQESKVAGYLLPPRLKAAGLDVKIWLWDHNYIGYKRVLDQLKDKNVLDAIDAVAWHPYCSDASMLRHVRKVHPNLRFEQTEMGPQGNSKKQTMIWWSRIVFDAFNNGCSSFNNWCLVLDPDGGPNASEGLDCYGLITLDPKTCAVTPSEQYRVFRHIGPFLDKGAGVLATSFTTSGYTAGARDLNAVAFRNIDGSDVVVVSCDCAERPFARRQFQFKKGGRYYSISLLPQTLPTFVVTP